MKKVPEGERKSRAELIKQVNKEIPYEVGNGNSTLARRSARLKVLLSAHGLPVNLDQRAMAYAPSTTWGL